MTFGILLKAGKQPLHREIKTAAWEDVISPHEILELIKCQQDLFAGFAGTKLHSKSA